MNPYDHARSSARLHGGRWSDYHALHAWFDLTKSTHCHFTHRALRHHHEGIAEAVAVFGSFVTNSDGSEVSTQALGRQHVEEDCQHVPAAADWLADFDTPDWLQAPIADSAELARLSALRLGGTPETYLALHEWMLASRYWTDHPGHLMFRHQSFGIYETENRFGAALGDKAYSVPTRVVAELHVRSILGRLPAAADLLRRLKTQRWMLQATSARRLGLA